MCGDGQHVPLREHIERLLDEREKALDARGSV